MTSTAPARSTAADTAAPLGQPGEVADPDAVERTQLEAEEVLERAAQPGPPLRHRQRGQVDAVDLDAPAVGRVHPGEQLDQRGLAGAVLADDGDDRAGGQVEADVVEHQPVGARVAERHVVEADAVVEAVGRRAVGARLGCRGIVLEPDQPPRDVEPDAAQEAELADRRRDVLRELAAGHQHEHDLSRRAVEPVGRVDDRADVGAGEDRPGERVPERGHPAGPGQRRVASAATPRAARVPGRRRCR